MMKKAMKKKKIEKKKMKSGRAWRPVLQTHYSPTINSSMTLLGRTPVSFCSSPWNL